MIVRAPKRFVKTKIDYSSSDGEEVWIPTERILRKAANTDELDRDQAAQVSAETNPSDYRYNGASTMNKPPDYFDLRSPFWRSCFEKASQYDDYLAQSPVHAARWHDSAAKVPSLTADQLQRLSGHHRSLRVLLLSGIWCGDCVRQGPMIRQIVDACDDDVRLRVIDREEDTKLRDEIRIIGAARVPVAVFLTEDFFEVGRFGDRMLAAYRKMAQSEYADLRYVSGRSPQDFIASELAEWVDIFERCLLMARLSPLLRRRHGD